MDTTVSNNFKGIMRERTYKARPDPSGNYVSEMSDIEIYQRATVRIQGSNHRQQRRQISGEHVRLRPDRSISEHQHDGSGRVP